MKWTSHKGKKNSDKEDRNFEWGRGVREGHDP